MSYTQALVQISEGQHAPLNTNFMWAFKRAGLHLHACFDLHSWHDPGADSTHCGLACSVMRALWQRHSDQVWPTLG